MENAIIKAQDKEMQYEVSGNEITLTPNMVKRFIKKGDAAITDEEAIMFMNLCMHKKLNPFLGEAYIVKFESKGVPQPAQMIVGKEAYMKRAFSQPDFSHFEAGVIIQRGKDVMELDGAFKLKSDVLLGGWAKIHRKDKVVHISRVSFDEYGSTKKIWAAKPCTMIRKVAIVQALREAYPEDLGGMYTEEETAEVEKVEPVSVEQEIQENANTEVIDIDEIEEEVKDVEYQPVEESNEQPQDGQIKMEF